MDAAATTGEIGIPRRRWWSRGRATLPSGFSVPSTKPSRSRLSNYLKPCTSSTTVRAPAVSPLTIHGELSKHTSSTSARECGTAGHRSGRRPRAGRPSILRTGAVRPGGVRKRAGPASDPIDVTRLSRLLGSRKPTARTAPGRVRTALRGLSSPPSLIVATRKMAAGVRAPEPAGVAGEGHR